MDVNYVELLAIHKMINYVILQHQYYLSTYDHMYIVTDNKQAMDWIAGDAEIKEIYIHNIINSVHSNFVNVYNEYKYIN